MQTASGPSGTSGPSGPAAGSGPGPDTTPLRNQTTPLLLDEADLLAVPDVPPPSYEEATAGQPPPVNTANATSPAASASSSLLQPPRQQRPASASMPGAYPSRPASFGGLTTTGLAPPNSSTAASSVGRRASATHTPSSSSTTTTPLPSFGTGGGDAKRPVLPQRTQQQHQGASSSSSSSFPRPTRTPAPGSIPRCQQFPPSFNLYGDGLARRFPDGTYGQQFWVGEHQHQPLYAVVMRSSGVWSAGQAHRPVIVLHNGPNAAAAPVLAAVQYVGGGTPLGDAAATAADITLPPPLTYSGRGSTAVRLSLVYGWSHAYHFAMEVGTTVAGAHMEAFEWRHSTGLAVAQLGGARDGWKLVRCSAPAPPQAAAQGRATSDGHEVVALMADARMSLTKHLKFAFAGTGRSGALGERWAVMAVASALVVWEKELGVRR